MRNTMKEEWIGRLNAATANERLEALRELAGMYKSGALASPTTGLNVNNHIHTTFSFSPYSPVKAAYLAWDSGLATAGIMDHDSVGGVAEFIEAANIIGLPVTVGFECRCRMTDTPFEGRRINNPDQRSVAYMAMHGIPHQMLGEAERFLAPYREKRNERNRKMVDKLDAMTRPYGLSFEYSRDVLPLSQYAFGGSVTERHILYALCSALSDREMARYFLLGVFKSYLMEDLYLNAEEELPHLDEFILLADKLGAIPAYAYLGDVSLSVTGDKRGQAFEDAYLDELIPYLSSAGIRAITYMPARNSAEQLTRLITLCKKHSLLEISGEDINSPLQSFICKKIETPEYSHLIDSAWALIGHELACSKGLSKGMFTQETIMRIPKLSDRIKSFAALAKHQCSEREGTG